MRSPLLLAAGALLVACLLVVPSSARPASAAAAITHEEIDGSGSTWAQNAINQWIGDVTSQGIKVVFTGEGSAAGRKDFATGTTDFAVSDIGYLGTDPTTGVADTSQGRAYAYLPIVSGGTSFPYHIVSHGQLVRSLRLSGLTLTKIFTNQITNWDDPAITADNNGLALPDLPIIPVVHAEGAGSTAQFTKYLAQEFPQQWTSFSGNASFTEYWPLDKTGQEPLTGSDSVMNFITSAAGNGSIGYDEYSYALNAQYPAARIENSADYFTAPTQYNVAVALTQAIINNNPSDPNYLLQDLHNVYGYNDPRTYPLSSYSYAIIPTSSTDVRMRTGKRQSLADFLTYSVCQGQASIGPTGYSALPGNLVQGSFDQIAKLGAADPSVVLQHDTISQCNNPTFDPSQPSSVNRLAEIAPQPPACAKAGAGPCMNGEDLVNGNPVNNQPSSGGGSSGGVVAVVGNTGENASSGSGGSSTSGTGSAGSTAAAGGTDSSSTSDSGGSSSDSGTPTIDPATGQVVSTGSRGGQSGASALAYGNPTDISASDATGGMGTFLAVLAVIFVLVLVAVPPTLLRRSRLRQGTS